MQAAETEQLIDKLFDGSPDLLFASLLGRKKFTSEQIEQLRKIVKDAEQSE